MENKRILKLSSIALLTVLVFSMTATTALAYQSSWNGYKPVPDPNNPSDTVLRDYKYQTENGAPGTISALDVDCYVENYVKNPSDDYGTITCDVGITATLFQHYIDLNSQGNGIGYFLDSILVTVPHSTISQDQYVEVSTSTACSPSCSNTLYSPTQLAIMDDNAKKQAELVLGLALTGITFIAGQIPDIPLWIPAIVEGGKTMAEQLYSYLAPPGYTPKYSDTPWSTSDLSLKWGGRNGVSSGPLTDHGWIYFRLLWHIKTDLTSSANSQQIVLNVALVSGKLTDIIHDRGHAVQLTYSETISTSITLTVNPITAPPSISIISPSDGSTLYTNGESGELMAKVHATDLQSSLLSVEIGCDSGSLVPASYDATGDYWWAVFAGLAAGSPNPVTHTITAKATNYGWLTSSASITVYMQRGSTPTIDTPLNVVYQNGTTGHSITWHSVDSFDPLDYTITRNGVVVGSGDWDGGDISISVDGLSCGTYVTSYQYVCTVRDLLGNTVTSGTTTVSVRLELVNPVIDSPPDVNYVADENPVMVYWHAWDAHPGTYVITKNGVTVQSGAWSSGTSISINVGGLGYWTSRRWITLNFQFTCTVYDVCGNSVSDTVHVSVLCAPEYG